MSSNFLNGYPAVSRISTSSCHSGNPRKRIPVFDICRGIAILGILTMNIQLFSMPDSAYRNPTAWGSEEDLPVWYITHLFADQKFMTILALLFGAGVILFAQRNSSAAWWRRSAVLTGLGLAHAYLLWYGDILFTYGVAGLIVWHFRQRSARWLAAAGLLTLLAGCLIQIALGLSLPKVAPDLWWALGTEWQPDGERLAWEQSVYLGSWSDALAHRIPASLAMQTDSLLAWGIWRAGGLMLLGMSLCKAGFFDTSRPVQDRITQGAVAFLAGFALTAYGVTEQFAHHWQQDYAMLLGSQWGYWGSLLIGFAYLQFITAWISVDSQPRIKKILARLGRHSLTHYLLQSILAGLIFYGYGAGLFGQADRMEQLGIVLLIWALQLQIATSGALRHISMETFVGWLVHPRRLSLVRSRASAEFGRAMASVFRIRDIARPQGWLRRP